MKQQAISVEGKEVKRVHKHDGEPVLYTRQNRPVFSPERGAARRLNRYYSRMAALCAARWAGKLLADATAALASARAAALPFTPWEAALEFRVTYDGGGLLSVCCDVSETRGDGRPVVHRTAVTWDTAAGAPRTLGSFFPDERRWKRRVIADLQTHAEARRQTGESLLDSDCAARLPVLFSPARFYLTEAGAEVFFPMDTIAPFAEGIPSFSVTLPQR